MDFMHRDKAKLTLEEYRKLRPNFGLEEDGRVIVDISDKLKVYGVSFTESGEDCELYICYENNNNIVPMWLSCYTNANNTIAFAMYEYEDLSSPDDDMEELVERWFLIGLTRVMGMENEYDMSIYGEFDSEEELMEWLEHPVPLY